MGKKNGVSIAVAEEEELRWDFWRRVLRYDDASQRAWNGGGEHFRAEMPSSRLRACNQSERLISIVFFVSFTVWLLEKALRTGEEERLKRVFLSEISKFLHFCGLNLTTLVIIYLFGWWEMEGKQAIFEKLSLKEKSEKKGQCWAQFCPGPNLRDSYGRVFSFCLPMFNIYRGDQTKIIQIRYYDKEWSCIRKSLFFQASIDLNFSRSLPRGFPYYILNFCVSAGSCPFHVYVFFFPSCAFGLLNSAVHMYRHTDNILRIGNWVIHYLGQLGILCRGWRNIVIFSIGSLSHTRFAFRVSWGLGKLASLSVGL